MLYSLNGNYPSELPHRIHMPDGTTRTDNSTFTDEEIAQAGYVAVNNKPAYAGDVEKVQWNSSTVSWDVLPLTEQELQDLANQKWATIRDERNQLLAQTDYIVLMHYELGEPVPQNVIDYRQALRDLPQTYDDISAIQWPTLNSDTVTDEPI